MVTQDHGYTRPTPLCQECNPRLQSPHMPLVSESPAEEYSGVCVCVCVVCARVSMYEWAGWKREKDVSNEKGKYDFMYCVTQYRPNLILAEAYEWHCS